MCRLQAPFAEQTIAFCTDPKLLDRFADDIVAYYKQKTDDSELKRVEKKIADTKKKIKDTTTAYIQAVATNNTVLKESCETHSTELGVLLDNLESEYSKLERLLIITKKDIIDTIKEYCKGNADDKEFQRRLISNLVNSVYCYDNKILILFNLDKNNKKPPLKTEIDEKMATATGSNITTTGGRDRI